MNQMPFASADIPAHVRLHNTPMGVWQSFRAVRQNVLNIIPEAATRLPILSGKTGTRWHMVMDPSALKHVLKDRLDDYPKSKVTKNLLRPAIGESMFVAEGAHWRWQRRAAAPVFAHRNISALAPIMSAAAGRSTQRIADAGPRAVDLLDEMVTATFDVISEVTFSAGGGPMASAEVHGAINAYIAAAGKTSLLDLFGAPDWIPRPNRFFGTSAVKSMQTHADQAIEARRVRGASDVPDLLDLLLAGSDPETKQVMNTAELRDNLLTFIVAGHETTALSLAWAWYLLAFDPEIQSRAQDEVTRQIGRGGTATAEDIADLPLTRAVIDESLRLYPPAALISRTAMQNDRLLDREIRKGDTIIIPVYALHRHKVLWDSPDAFQPDRWLSGKPERYSYLPFGEGPRVCIGAAFAIQEAVIILATLMARFRFTPVAGRDPTPKMILTLRPEGGVWLEATPL